MNKNYISVSNRVEVPKAPRAFIEVVYDTSKIVNSLDLLYRYAINLCEAEIKVSYALFDRIQQLLPGALIKLSSNRLQDLSTVADYGTLRKTFGALIRNKNWLVVCANSRVGGLL